MDTSIQISRELMEKLKMMKINEKESYENIIWDLLEDRREFADETNLNIENSRKEIQEKKTVSLEEIKNKLNS